MTAWVLIQEQLALALALEQAQPVQVLAPRVQEPALEQALGLEQAVALEQAQPVVELAPAPAPLEPAQTPEPALALAAAPLSETVAASCRVRLITRILPGPAVQHPSSPPSRVQPAHLPDKSRRNTRFESRGLIGVVRRPINEGCRREHHRLQHMRMKFPAI